MIFWIVFILIMLLCFAPINFGGISHSSLRRNLGYTIIIFITIFRFDVGFDYIGYFQNIYPIFDYQSYNRLEPFGKMAMNISHYYNNPQLFFILYGIVTFTCLLFVFTKYSKNIFLSIFFYLAFFYLPGLSTIRQEAAVFITFAGYYFIKRNKPLVYLLICLLASLFHSSALIAIFFYPFLKINKIKNTIISALAIIAFMGILMKIILSIPTFAAYYHYIEDAESYKGGSMIRYLYLLVSILLFILSLTKYQNELTKLSLLSLIGCSISFILGGHIGGRIAEYFTIYLCIGISNILACNYKKYIMPVGISLSLLFLANIYISMKNPTKSPYTPYKSVLFVDIKNPKFK